MEFRMGCTLEPLPPEAGSRGGPGALSQVAAPCWLGLCQAFS